jgi:hypothetical protein
MLLVSLLSGRGSLRGGRFNRRRKADSRREVFQSVTVPI